VDVRAEVGTGTDAAQAQREAVTAFVRGRGWDLIDTVSERGGSTVRAGELSSIEHRPKLAALLKRAEARDFDVLVVAAYSRLSADKIDAQLLRQSFGRHGVEVVSAAGEVAGDPGELGVLIDRVLGRTDPLERGKQAARRAGRHAHGRIPYGYVSTGRGRLEEHEQHAAIVRRIFTAAGEGKSLHAIARELNADSVPSPQARNGVGKWAPTTVSRILGNRVYVGKGAGRGRPLVDRTVYDAAQRRPSSRA
jgi:DNA invertase Pin-like site-specific DNA recombinase